MDEYNLNKQLTNQKKFFVDAKRIINEINKKTQILIGCR